MVTARRIYTLQNKFLFSGSRSQTNEPLFSLMGFLETRYNCLTRSKRCVADVKSTTSKIKYYKTTQYSTIKKTGFTISTEKTKKY